MPLKAKVPILEESTITIHFIEQYEKSRYDLLESYNNCSTRNHRTTLSAGRINRVIPERKAGGISEGIRTRPAGWAERAVEVRSGSQARYTVHCQALMNE